MPPGTNRFEVHNGKLRVRCVACGTIARAPADGRLRGSAQEQCRYLCHEIQPGIFYDAYHQKYRVTDATIDRLVEAHKLAAKCCWSWPVADPSLSSRMTAT